MERILIADDVSVDRRILIALLGGKYEITECVNGREVINQLKKNPNKFDILLLDIKMPEVDGFGVLKFMREQGLLDKLPVIALTALSEASDHLRCYEAGVSDLLEKPYNQQILQCKIRVIIDKFNKKAPTPVEIVTKHLVEEMKLPEDTVAPIIDEAKVLYADMIKQIKALKEPYDIEKLREITHTLIGNSQNMGYTALYEAAVSLNGAAHANIKRSIVVGIKQVLACLEAF